MKALISCAAPRKGLLTLGNQSIHWLGIISMICSEVQAILFYETVFETSLKVPHLFFRPAVKPQLIPLAPFKLLLLEHLYRGDYKWEK